jgi:hypothetical protein
MQILKIPSPACCGAGNHVQSGLHGLTYFETYLPSAFGLMGAAMTVMGNCTELNHLKNSNRSPSWVHRAFLSSLPLNPLSPSMLAKFLAYRQALAVYWLNILMVDSLLCGCLRQRNGTLDLPSGVAKVIKRRILRATTAARPFARKGHSSLTRKLCRNKVRASVLVQRLSPIQTGGWSKCFF